MTTRLLLALTATVGLAAFDGARPVAAAFTCSTVARRGVLGPDGLEILRRFEGPAINQAGDVVFAARPRGARQRLYLYPGAGPAVVIAAGNSPAPGGPLFRTFSALSINDGGDIGFFSRTTGGEGVYLRQSGAPIEIAAAATQTSPAGGGFSRFPQVSAVNGGAQIAFSAKVNGGPSGIFRYDGPSNTLATVLLFGAGIGGGRQLCEFGEVGLGEGATPALAFVAETKVDCADEGELAVEGLFLHRLGVVTTIALAGQPSPIVGATYEGLGGIPEVTALDHVVFRADVTGALEGAGVFLHDPVGATTVEVARTGGIPPETSGFYSRFDAVRASDADTVFIKAGLGAGTAKTGIFLYDGSPESVLLSSAPPPADLFAPGAAYSRLGVIAVAGDGSRLALIARVKDGAAPRLKHGVLRCVP